MARKRKRLGHITVKERVKIFHAVEAAYRRCSSEMQRHGKRSCQIGVDFLKSELEDRGF
jgi:hypothetical protein